VLFETVGIFYMIGTRSTLPPFGQSSKGTIGTQAAAQAVRELDQLARDDICAGRSFLKSLRFGAFRLNGCKQISIRKMRSWSMSKYQRA
jgi:hypothetical protein